MVCSGMGPALWAPPRCTGLMPSVAGLEWEVAGMGGSAQCSLPCPPAAQASIVAALSSDLGKVAQLVEQAGEALASDPAASVQVRL